MRTATRFAPALLTLGTLLLAACGILPPAGPIQSHGGPVRDHVSFVDTLRGRGLTVDPTAKVQQPFLHSQSGTVLHLSQGNLAAPVDVQSYDYAAAATADADMATIDGSGNPRGTQVDWIAPPHFYSRERLVVLYTGSDPTVLRLLSDVVGPQRAGPK